MKTAVPRSPDGKPLWYGRRRSHKLRPGRQQLLDELLPKIAVSLPDGDAPVDLGDYFPSETTSIRLEIGFGSGEHLSGDAAAHPDVGFIGCEPFVNGVAALLADIENRNLANVRVYDDDVRLLLARLPDAALERIYILFPDPWPKARHHRRRIVQTEILDELARVAADGAELVFASDHMGYVAWTLSLIRRHSDWSWTATRPDDWRRPPADWVPTRYEAKAVRKGLKPAYLRFRRRPRT